MKKRILSYLPKAEDGLTVAQRALLKAKADQEAKNSQTETLSKSSVAKKPVTKKVVKTPSVVKKPIAPKPVVQQPVYNYSNWVGPTGFSQTNVGISKPSIVAAGVYSKGYTGHKTNSQQAVVEENIEESENQEPSLLDEVTEKAKRALGLYLNVSNEDPTVDVSQVKEIPINNTETNVNYNHFQKLNIPQDPGLFSYIRQGLNTDSLDYFTGPAKITYNSQNNKTPFSRSGVEGIGHHLIMSVAPDFTDFTDRSTLDYASRIMLQNTPDDNYIPIIRKHPGEKLKLTYRKRSDLAKEVGNYQPQIEMGPFTYSQTSPLSFKEIGLQKQKKPSNFLYNDPDVFSPLRLEQWKFGDLDFGDLGKTNVFKWGIEGVYDKKNKRYNRSLVTSGNLDSYGKFSGASTVFIFTDPKTKQEIVREVTGPLSLIKQEGEKIASDFGIDKNDITIGVYDAGSVNYKRAADNNYYMSPKRLYMEQTPGTMAGSSLLIPKGGKFKQGGTMIPKKQYAGPYTNEPTKEFSNFYKDIKQLYPNVSDEQILNYWQQGYADDFTAKNPFLATTPLIPGSQSTFEQYGISEPYINQSFNENYNEPDFIRYQNEFLSPKTVIEIGNPYNSMQDPRRLAYVDQMLKNVSKQIKKDNKKLQRNSEREEDEFVLPTEESTSWRNIDLRSPQTQEQLLQSIPNIQKKMLLEGTLSGLGSESPETDFYTPELLDEYDINPNQPTNLSINPRDQKINTQQRVIPKAKPLNLPNFDWRTEAERWEEMGWRPGTNQFVARGAAPQTSSRYSGGLGDGSAMNTNVDQSSDAKYRGGSGDGTAVGTNVTIVPAQGQPTKTGSSSASSSATQRTPLLQGTPLKNAANPLSSESYQNRDMYGTPSSGFIDTGIPELNNILNENINNASYGKNPQEYKSNFSNNFSNNFVNNFVDRFEPRTKFTNLPNYKKGGFLPKAQSKGRFDPEEERKRIEQMNIIADYAEPGIYTGNAITALNKAASAVQQSRNTASTQPSQFPASLGQPQLYGKPQTPAISSFRMTGQNRPITSDVNNIEQAVYTPKTNSTFGQPQFYQKPEVPLVNTFKVFQGDGPGAPDVDMTQAYADFNQQKQKEESGPSFASRMWKGANADNIMLGTKALNNLLERTPDYSQFQRNYKEPGQSMSRGDWTTNQGFLQPNRLGYFDKFSVGTGSMQFGGEVDMSDDEIYEFLAAGGELEFID